MNRSLRVLKRWPGWVALAFVVVGFLAVGATRDGGPQTPEDRVQSVTQRLACPVCEGESVFESRNPASEGIRNAVEERVEDGTMTDDEIVAYVESRQDATVLLVPKSTGVDALVWALPAVAFVCTVAGLIVAFRRWRATDPEAGDPSEDDRELVAAALASDGDDSAGDPASPPT